MNYLQLCRLCAENDTEVDAKDLFDPSQNELLKYIKIISDLELKNDMNVPSKICSPCQQDLEKSYKFRQRLISSQEFFHIKSTSVNKYRRNSEVIIQEQKVETTVPQKVAEEQEATLIDNKSQLLFIKNEPEHDMDNGGDVDVFAMENNCDEMEIVLPETFLADERNALEYDSNTENKSEVKKKTTMKERKKIKGGQPKRHELICDKCGNHFTSRQHFIVHLRRHMGDKTFHCEICPYKFFTHSELTRHMRRHTGERPFACRHCNRRFTDYSTNIKHERTHTDERPYSCTQCGKSFTTGYVLKNHMLIHTGERSFKCTLCNKAFQRQTHLSTHYRSMMHKQNEWKQKAASAGSDDNLLAKS